MHGVHRLHMLTPDWRVAQAITAGEVIFTLPASLRLTSQDNMNHPELQDTSPNSRLAANVLKERKNSSSPFWPYIMVWTSSLRYCCGLKRLTAAHTKLKAVSQLAQKLAMCLYAVALLDRATVQQLNIA